MTARTRLAEVDALSEVRFIHDYVQFIFEPHTLSLYATDLWALFGTERYGFYDSICSLIGHRLIAVTRQELEWLEFGFSNGTKVVASCRRRSRPRSG